MSIENASREQNSRAAEEFHPEDEEFSPALLNTKHMPPREGMEQRWIRTTIQGEDDQSNVFRAVNQGWKPRKADTVTLGQFVPTINYQGANIIGIRGMILMERPVEMGEKQRAYYDRQADTQIAAVEQNMHKVREKGSGLTRPEFTERKSSVSRGKIAPVAPD